MPCAVESLRLESGIRIASGTVWNGKVHELGIVVLPCLAKIKNTNEKCNFRDRCHTARDLTSHGRAARQTRQRAGAARHWHYLAPLRDQTISKNCSILTMVWAIPTNSA